MSWWLIPPFFVGAVLLTLPIDALLRRMFWRGQRAAKIDVLTTDHSDGTLIIYLPGIVANPNMIPSRIADTWAANGRVWGVQYLSPRFRPKEVVQFVVDEIVKETRRNSTRKIVFIGSSMGGLLAYDIQQRLYILSSIAPMPLSMVVVDAPTSRHDLQAPFNVLSLAVKVLPFGPLWNNLSWLLMKFFFVPPKEGEIDADVSRGTLDWHVKAARSFPVSFWRDQSMYILNHGVPAPGSIHDALIYIRSSKDDDTVRREAAEKWQNALSSKSSRSFMLDAEGAKHAAYAQNPSAYVKVFPIAFQLLGP